VSLTRQARIRRAFSQATDYDAHALAQAGAAAHLAGLILARGLPPGARVLDAGCGTGFLAERLIARGGIGRYVLADISPVMLGRARARLAGAAPGPLACAMDIQHPALRPGFDLVASSMALHWTEDMGRAVAALWKLLRPGGLLAVCVPGPDTFAPWRAAHRALDLPCGLQEFPTPEALAALFPVRPEITSQMLPVRLRGALDLPRHLRAVGGRVPRQGHAPLSPAQFRAVLRQADASREPMAYHALYALASRPALG